MPVAGRWRLAAISQNEPNFKLAKTAKLRQNRRNRGIQNMKIYQTNPIFTKSIQRAKKYKTAPFLF